MSCALQVVFTHQVSPQFFTPPIISTMYSPSSDGVGATPIPAGAAGKASIFGRRRAFAAADDGWPPQRSQSAGPGGAVGAPGENKTQRPPALHSSESFRRPPSSAAKPPISQSLIIPLVLNPALNILDDIQMRRPLTGSPDDATQVGSGQPPRTRQLARTASVSERAAPKGPRDIFPYCGIGYPGEMRPANRGRVGVLALTGVAPRPGAIGTRLRRCLFWPSICALDLATHGSFTREIPSVMPGPPKSKTAVPHAFQKSVVRRRGGGNKIGEAVAPPFVSWLRAPPGRTRELVLRTAGPFART